MTLAEDRGATLARLRSDLRRFDQSESGIAGTVPAPGPLDWLLANAWRPGGVIEFVGDQAGGWTLAGSLARERRGAIVLIDSSRIISPFALSLLGIDLSRLLVVRPTNKRLTLWAIEQSLRCPGVVATLCQCGSRLGTTAARRLKLAAEAGGGIGLIIRSAAREPPFGDLRLLIKPLPSLGKNTLRPRLGIETVYQRGGREGATCEIEFSEDANLVPLVSPVARPAGGRLGRSG